MIIIEKLLGKLEDFEAEGLQIDKVMLDRHDMAKPHQKLKTESGETIAVSLEHGESLFCGAVLYREHEKIIVVDLLPEDALEICPKGNLQWAKTAFNIGNMHHPAYLHDDHIIIPYDPIVESLLKGIGVEYVRCRKQLTGEKAGIVVGGHSHRHDHHHGDHHGDHHHHHGEHHHD